VLPFRHKLTLDVASFVAYLAATNTAITGIAVHEWLCVGLAVAFAFHTTLHWDWAMRMFADFIRKLLSMSRLNFVLDILLFVVLTAVMLSGFMVSRSVLPTLGLSVPFGPSWRILHSITAKLLLLVLGAHVGLHWRWILIATQRSLPWRARPVESSRAEV
jgi:hypothetical protein